MIATFMAWLSDTEAGGNTIYCQPGKKCFQKQNFQTLKIVNNCKCLDDFLILGHEGKITPEKGAAAFWYDVLSDGYKDIYSLHGGCPVLMGSKWILNKWLYFFDNFKKFPCKLAKQTRFSTPSKKHYF